MPCKHCDCYQCIGYYAKFVYNKEIIKRLEETWPHLRDKGRMTLKDVGNTIGLQKKTPIELRYILSPVLLKMGAWRQRSNGVLYFCFGALAENWREVLGLDQENAVKADDSVNHFS